MNGAVQTRRGRLQEQTRDEIKAVARRQMAREGASALSLRAIAGEMGLTAPALYRYYPSRDELITALIVDAFHALGDVLEGARGTVVAEAHANQFVAMMHAYRAWALAHPAEFTLIYGTPIPGYHAPEVVTDPAVRRSLAPLLALLAAAWQAGKITPDPAYAAPPRRSASASARCCPERRGVGCRRRPCTSGSSPGRISRGSSCSNSSAISPRSSATPNCFTPSRCGSSCCVWGWHRPDRFPSPAIVTLPRPDQTREDSAMPPNGPDS